ncbi:MAG: M20/M25/M40 family metallo-hydrolase, partial [Blastocatellia bacterium]
MKEIAAFLVFLALGCSAMAQSKPAYQPAPEKDREVAVDIFRQLIETNTSHSVGSVTEASKEMQKRFLDAGFSASDVMLLGPSERKQNLVVRYRGTGARKPILI